jgi:hypothetical protein
MMDQKHSESSTQVQEENNFFKDRKSGLNSPPEDEQGRKDKERRLYLSTSPYL